MKKPNTVWPTQSKEQKGKIEKTEQAILDARALYLNSTLAYLYDYTFMSPEFTHGTPE